MIDILANVYEGYALTQNEWSRLHGELDTNRAERLAECRLSVNKDSQITIASTRVEIVDFSEASCRGQGDIFFAPDNETAGPREVRERAARAICRACVLVEPCFEKAMRKLEQYGVWGGTTEIERQSIARKRRNAFKL